MENVTENVAETSISTCLGEKNLYTTKRKKPTIVTNKDAINAPLETNEQIRSIASQSFSPNSLQSVKYCLTLAQKGKLFAELEMEYQACRSVDLPELNWFPSATDVIRPKLTGYVISNSSADRNRSEADSVKLTFDVDSDGESGRRIEESNSFRANDFRPISNSSLDYSYRRFTDEVTINSKVLEPIASANWNN